MPRPDKLPGLNYWTRLTKSGGCPTRIAPNSGLRRYPTRTSLMPRIQTAAITRNRAAKIFSWFVKAATAEGSDQVRDAFRYRCFDSPVAPVKRPSSENENASRHLRLQASGLSGPPFSGARREHARAEHIEKAVHLCSNLVAKLPDRMMKPGGELYRNAITRGLDERNRDVVAAGNASACTPPVRNLNPQTPLSICLVSLRQHLNR